MDTWAQGATGHVRRSAGRACCMVESVCVHCTCLIWEIVGLADEDGCFVWNVARSGTIPLRLNIVIVSSISITSILSFQGVLSHISPMGGQRELPRGSCMDESCSEPYCLQQLLRTELDMHRGIFEKNQ